MPLSIQSDDSNVKVDAVEMTVVSVEKASAEGTAPVSEDSRSMSSHLMGVIMLLVVSAIWAGTSYITQEIDHPTFVSYVNSAMSSIYMVIWYVNTYRKRVQLKSESGSPIDLAEMHNDMRTMIRETMWLALRFLPLCFLMSFPFNLSFRYTNLSTNSIVSTSATFFTLTFSFCILRSPIRTLNIVGAMFTFGGIACAYGGMASNTSVESVDDNVLQHVFGGLLALVSAIVGGFYYVYLKKMITPEKNVDMSLFFGLIGCFGTVLLFPTVIITQVTGFEESVLALPGAEILMVLGQGVLTIMCNFILAKAILMTSPFLTTVGMSMTTPLSMLLDIIFKAQSFTYVYYTGVALVIIGYVITNVQFNNEESEKDDNAKECSLHTNDETTVTIR